MKLHFEINYDLYCSAFEKARSEDFTEDLLNSDFVS